MKRIITIILCAVLCLVPMAGFASAESLSQGYAGNVDYLIDIKNPEAVTTSTASKVCVVSAVAAPGTTVTLYKYDESAGKYVKMYSDGKALEAVVGAAGLFAQNIELKNGSNNILVVAAMGDNVETIKLDITLVKNNSISDSLRNLWQTIIGN